MKIYIKIFILSLSVFTTRCTSIENPKLIGIESFEIVKNKSDQLTMNSDVRIYNPNRFSISSDNVSFNLFLDSLYLGKGSLSDDLTLTKKDTSLISSSIILNKRHLYSLINLKDSVSLKIIGSTEIPIISRTHYFDLEYKLDIESLISKVSQKIINDLKIKINEVRIKKVDLKNILMEITVGLNNKTEIGSSISKMNINVYKSENYKEILSSSVIKESFILNPMSLNEFTLDVRVNTLKMGAAFLTNSLKNKNSLYIEITSKLKYDNIEIPYSLKRRIDYNPITLEILLR